MSTDFIVDSVLRVDKIISDSAIISIPLNGNIISCLTIDGMVIPNKNGKYIVRVIASDDSENEFLIAEAFRESMDADTILFHNYSIETFNTHFFQPQIKIYCVNASITLQNVRVNMGVQFRNLNEDNDSLKYKQVEEIVNNINEYNIQNGKLWVAGVTPLSLKSFEERKRILGISNNTYTGGLEYYQGGIFEVGEPIKQENRTNVQSLYVSSFDWRNRHGKNWMTPAKDQGDSGYCVAFAATSVTEAMANLYYNQLLNLDLSEQQLACFAKNDGRPNVYYSGMPMYKGLEYIMNNGVCDEVSYPFVDSPDSVCRNIEMNPNNLVTISNYEYVGSNVSDNIKSALINKGPLVSGIRFTGVNHAMTLVGYRDIQEGDSIYRIVEYDAENNLSGMYPQMYVPIGSEYIGKTCWIFKDNYPLSRTFEGGYMYILFHEANFLNSTYAANTPISIIDNTSLAVQCLDEDGDGYYFWGIGPKPDSISTNIPDLADGDDSDCMSGPMTSYGFLEDLNPDHRDTIYISSSEIYEDLSSVYNHICIKANGVLTVTNAMNFYNGADIIVEGNGTLCVNAGTLNNANIYLNEGSILNITNGGTINLEKGKKLDIPLDVNFFIDHGSVINNELYD